jgi:hypothetical protein
MQVIRSRPCGPFLRITEVVYMVRVCRRGRQGAGRQLNNQRGQRASGVLKAWARVPDGAAGLCPPPERSATWAKSGREAADTARDKVRERTQAIRSMTSRGTRRRVALGVRAVAARVCYAQRKGELPQCSVSTGQQNLYQHESCPTYNR